jgi:hypothetical protein
MSPYQYKVVHSKINFLPLSLAEGEKLAQILRIFCISIRCERIVNDTADSFSACHRTSVSSI